MNNPPEISIIVPIYKAEEYLSRCIDSILTQTFTNFELLLIDDGSPDRCGEICEEYILKDKRIRVFHQENAGVSAARNKGIEKSEGRYIVFVDSDDRVLPDYLLHLYEARLIGKGAGLVIMGFLKYTLDGEYIGEAILPDVLLLQSDFGKVFTTYNISGMGYSCSKLYDRDVISNYHLRFDVRVKWLEDLFFMYQYMLVCDYLVLGSKTDYIYVKHGSSLSATIGSFDSIYVGFLLYQSLLENILQRWNLTLDELTTTCHLLMMNFDCLLKADYQPGRYVARKKRVAHIKMLVQENYALMVKRHHPVYKLDMLGHFMLRCHCYGIYDWYISILFKLNIGPVLFGPSRICFF